MKKNILMRRCFASAAFILLAALLFPSSALTAPPTNPEEAMLAAFARYDEKAFADAMHSMALQAPDSYEAEFCLRAVMGEFDGIYSASVNRWQEEQLVTEIFSKLPDCYNKTVLSDTVTFMKYSRGEEEKAMELWRASANISEWLIAGPVGDNGPAGFYERLAPEKGVDLSAKYSSAGKEYGWQRVVMDYPGLAFPGGRSGPAIHYMAVFVESPSARTARFELNLEGSYKFFVNGAQVAVSDESREYATEEKVFIAGFNAGWNLVLVKRDSLQSGGSILLTDVNGVPFKDVKYRTEGFEGGKAPSIGPYTAPAPDTDYYKDIFAHYSDKKPRTYFDDYKLIMLLGSNNQIQEAFALAAEFQKNNPEDPLACWLLAEAYSRMGEFLVDDAVKNGSREWHEKALEKDPSFVPSLLGLAGIFEDKDFEKAHAYLKKAEEVNPSSFAVRDRLMRLYSSKGWDGEEIVEMKKMLELHPENTSVLDDWMQYYLRRDNFVKAKEYAAKLTATLNLPAINGYTELFFFREGRHDELVAKYLGALARHPDSVNAVNEAIDILERQGKFEQVEKILNDFAERAVAKGGSYIYQVSWAYGELAGVYMRQGQKNKARDILRKQSAFEFEKSAQVNGGIEAALLRLEGRDSLAFSLCERDIRKVAENAPGRDKYPDKESVILLYQMVLEFDGRELCLKNTCTNIVIKILSKSAGEEYGQGGDSEGMVEYRVLTPDGKVLEPDPSQERGAGRLPKMDIGSVMQMFSSETRPVSYSKYYRMFDTSFNFKMPETPALKVEYILIFPEGAGGFEIKPFNGAGEPERTVVDGKAIYKWSMKDVKDFKPERMMPSGKELFPYVKTAYGKPKSYGDIGKLSAGRMDLKAPNTVRDKALELCAGLASNSEKARKIYEFAVTEIKSGYSSNAAQTLALKEGSAPDLVQAMFVGAGVDFRFALTAPEEGKDLYIGPDKTEREPSYSGGLLFVPADNGEGGDWLYPMRFMPYGAIPSDYFGAKALLVDKDYGITFTSVPKPEFRSTVRLMGSSVKIRPDGSGEYEFYQRFLPEEGAGLLAAVKENMEPRELKMQLEGMMSGLFPGASVASWTLPEFSMDAREYGLTIKGVVKKFATKSGSSLKFRLSRTPVELTRLLTETKREFPLRLSSELAMMEKGSFEAPEGYRFAAVAGDSMVNKFGKYTLKVKQEGATMSFEKVIAIDPQNVMPEDYKEFMEFCRKIEAFEKTQVEIIKM